MTKQNILLKTNYYELRFAYKRQLLCVILIPKGNVLVRYNDITRLSRSRFVSEKCQLMVGDIGA